MTPTLALGSDSIFSGRGIAQALSRWLEQIPPGARHLTVGIRDRESQSQEVLARWPLPDCDPGAWPTIATEWAGKIYGLINDCAHESRATAHGVVRWLDGDGNTLSVRRVSVRFQGDGSEDETYREANTAAVIGQLMSHQQVLMDNLTAVTQHNVVESAKRADHAYQRLLDLELENKQLRMDLEKTRAEMLSDDAERVIAESMERDPAMERMEQLLQMVIAKWMSNQNQAKLPPATQDE